MGRDHTLYALKDGTVHFSYVLRHGHRHNKWRKFINILTNEQTKQQLDEFTAQEQQRVNQYRINKRKGTLPPTEHQIYLKSIRQPAKDQFLSKQRQELEEYIKQLNLDDSTTISHTTQQQIVSAA